MSIADDVEYDSDRELACPPKKRKQEHYLTLPNDDSEMNSLSRSSSLLQFETLEKQCQETLSCSPCKLSSLNTDINEKKGNSLSENSRDGKNLCSKDETEWCQGVKNHSSTKTKKINNNFFNEKNPSISVTLDNGIVSQTSISSEYLKVWTSYDSLCVKNKDKISIENLSQDSGFGDHIAKSYSSNNLKERRTTLQHNLEEKIGFSAYDGDIFQWVS